MWTASAVLSLSTRICTSLGLQYTCSQLEDINVNFLQDVLERLVGFRSTASSAVCVLTEHLDKISEVTQVPIHHIQPSDLLDSDLTAWGNLLEILEFLVNFVRANESSDGLEQSLSSSASTQSLCSPVKYSALDDMTDRVNNLLMELDSNKFPVIPRESAEGQTHRDNFSEYSSSDIMDRNLGCSPKTQYNASRLLYLREKLRECLQDKDFAHLPRDQSRSDPRATSFKHTNSNNCSRTSASVCGSEYGNSGGLVKPNVRPLIWYTHDRRTQHPRTPEMEPVLTNLLDEPGDLLDKLLAAFPTLDLDGHDTRVLRRKAANLLGACSAVSSRPASLPGISPSDRQKLTWVEERNRRRLAQLLRHSMRMSRFRDQKTADEEDRRLRAQLQERRRQLIRIRSYYQQFVSDFRAKKMAKVFQEEKVFRDFFQGLLAQERENLMDIQKLEREERNKSRVLKEEQMANLEYTRRARMALIKERLEQEEAQRTNSERQQRLELIKRRRELRHMLETNLRELQRNMLENHDSVYFREKDASRMLQH
ncbi:hypothetical protein CRM22_000214 [Opisthorchis felineus]|uniref:DUF5745 domain-containing protein n=1 Tax=Opisthorchis felineus TaxID=147828 RepID=A0A4S2MFZ4_OPIFE|nr:hypothetical protein CRM22_000214 [Opisthorchis felineus]